MRRAMLMTLALAACTGAEVTQPVISDPEGMVRVIPPDGESIGKMHNEALAWVLADLQIAKRRMGDKWNPEALQAEASKSESRFLKRYPSVDRTTYYRIKMDRLASPTAASALDQLDPAGVAAVRSVEVASTLYWTAMRNEWRKLANGSQFAAAALDDNETLLRIIKADIYGAAAGWIGGGPQGAIAGAIAMSLVEVIVIVVEEWWWPTMSRTTL